MKILHAKSWLVLLLLYPCIIFADYHMSYSQGSQPGNGPAVGSTEYHLIVSPEDAESPDAHSNTKAYQIITYLFGTISASKNNGIVCMASSTQPCSNIAGELFNLFNTGLIVSAMLMMSYVIVQTALVDSYQGLATGQKYSHGIIPLRSVLGVIFLIPTQTGYGLGQILIARIILLGSSAGTGVWQYLLTYYNATGEPMGTAGLMYSGNSTVESGTSIAETFVQNMAKLAACNAYVNTPNGRAAQFPSNPPPPSSIFTSQFYSSDESSYTIQTGVEGAPSDAAYAMNHCYCGGIPLGVLEAGQESVLQNYVSQITGLSEQFVIEFQQNNEYLSPTAIDNYQSQYSIIMNLLKTDLLLNAYHNSQNQQSNSSKNQTQLQSEWLDAPQYFFGLLSSGKVSSNLQLNQSLSPKPPALPTDSDLTQATNFSQNAEESDDVNMKIELVGSSGATKDFQSYMRQMLRATDGNQDALMGLAAVGQKFFDIALQLMIVSFIFTSIVVTLTHILSDFINIGVFGVLTSGLTLVATVFQAVGLIIPVASIFAIALPMTPLIIYTSAIISWTFGSVIAIMGAPIICLGLISHSGGLGKATPALMIVINAFIRPSLNVVGLVGGAKLFNIFYFFFTQGFILTVNAIMSTIGIDNTALMSITSIMFLYVYTFYMAAACTRCYSLIYLLPDRVLTWVSASPAVLSESTQGSQIVGQTHRQASQSMKRQYEQMSKAGSRILEQEISKAYQKYRSDDYKGPKRLPSASELMQTGADYLGKKVIDPMNNMLNKTSEWLKGDKDKGLDLTRRDAITEHDRDLKDDLDFANTHPNDNFRGAITTNDLTSDERDAIQKGELEDQSKFNTREAFDATDLNVRNANLGQEDRPDLKEINSMENPGEYSDDLFFNEVNTMNNNTANNTSIPPNTGNNDDPNKTE